MSNRFVASVLKRSQCGWWWGAIPGRLESGLFRTDGDAQLVLITCGGPFDPVRHRYADNYVVVARPAS